jgi:hypothetical protein
VREVDKTAKRLSRGLHLHRIAGVAGALPGGASQVKSPTVRRRAARKGERSLEGVPGCQYAPTTSTRTDPLSRMWAPTDEAMRHCFMGEGWGSSTPRSRCARRPNPPEGEAGRRRTRGVPASHVQTPCQLVTPPVGETGAVPGPGKAVQRAPGEGGGNRGSPPGAKLHAGPLLGPLDGAISHARRLPAGGAERTSPPPSLRSSPREPGYPPAGSVTPPRGAVKPTERASISSWKKIRWSGRILRAAGELRGWKWRVVEHPTSPIGIS